MLARRGVEDVERHAGLHHGDGVDGVDLEDPVHAGEREEHRAVVGGRGAREAGARAPGGDGRAGGPRAAVTTATTSSRSAGHTTYAGLPAGTPSASSAHRSATDGSSPAITCSAPTASASAWNIPVS